MSVGIGLVLVNGLSVGFAGASILHLGAEWLRQNGSVWNVWCDIDFQVAFSILRQIEPTSSNAAILSV